MEELLRFLETQGPAAFILGVFLFGFFRRWWIIGSFYAECEERTKIANKRAEEWERRAIRGIKTSEDAMHVAEEAVNGS